jgi:photosystem II stability/assembly factor-like uncharacterized protein
MKSPLVSRAILFALLIHLSAVILCADVNSWTSMNLGGGEIAALVVDPQNSQTVYAGTARSGLFKSTDGGGRWQSINNGIGWRDMGVLAISSANPQTLFAGSYNAGIYRSMDGGASWTALNSPNNIRTLTVDPANPQTVFAGTAFSLYKSTDNGGFWREIGIDLYIGPVNAIAIDPANSRTVYAGTYFGILKSTDAGESWAPLITGMFYTTRALVIDRQNTNTIYAGTDQGIFKSTDQGSTWATVWCDNYSYIVSLAADPLSPQIIYAGTSESGVYKTSDGGVNWISIGADLEGWVANALVLSSPQVLYAATDGAGVYKSTNFGENWAQTNKGMGALAVNKVLLDRLSPQIIYACTSVSGIYRSTDGGVIWKMINKGLTGKNISDIVQDPVNPNTLYARAPGGHIFKSMDSGSNWNSLDMTGDAMALDRAAPWTLYAGQQYGVYISSDYGASWIKPVNDLQYTAVRTLTIDPLSPLIVYAGTYGKGIFKSTDGGTSWSALNSGLSNDGLYVSTLAIHPTNPQILFLGSMTGGIFKSTNGGNSWSVASSGLSPNTNISSIIFDPSSTQTIYAALPSKGVFKSINLGNSWQSMNTNLSSLEINALAMDSGIPKIYAGGSGGIWEYAFSPSSRAKVLSVSPNTADAGSDAITLTVRGQGFTNSSIVHWNESYLRTTFVSPTELTAEVPRELLTNPEAVIISAITGDVSSSAVDFVVTIPVVQVAFNTDPPGVRVLIDDIYYATPKNFLWRKGSTHTLAPGTPVIIGDARYRWRAWSDSGVESHSVRVLESSLQYTAYFDTEYYLNLSCFPAEAGSVTVDPPSMDGFYLKDTVVQLTAAANRGYYFALWSGSWPGNSNIITGTMTSPIEITAYYQPFGNSHPYSLSSGMGASVSTIGGDYPVRTGYASVAINEQSDDSAPYGTAVFSFKQNGFTVTEAGVPASPPTTASRVFIDYRSKVPAVPAHADAGVVNINTGIAVANPGAEIAHITYILRNASGEPIAVGHGSIVGLGHFVCFIDELKKYNYSPDFVLPLDFQEKNQFGSLDIVSDYPLSVVALRGTNNQRNDFLITTTPVADLARSPNSDPIYFPQFANGGGYTSSLILMNTTDATEKGNFQILDKDGHSLAVTRVDGSPDYYFRYEIPPHGIYRFQTDGSPAEVSSGWVRLSPDLGHSTPVGSGIFSYNPESILLSESGIPAATPTTHARVFVDLSANHNTGLAIANILDAEARIEIRAYELDGVTPASESAEPLILAPDGYSVAFADQFLPSLSEGFIGLLDIRSTTPFSALTLRSLLNERHDFLMATFPVADQNRGGPAPIVFPQIADGGGYRTQFILISPEGQARVALNLSVESRILFGE